ncbi:MAG: tripartite tricarboxylate transporter substrate binding protein [Betaproteobacteria bacterium]|nr:tripartite tricarboxylate transporter substrate binding protein [Betaproteobacteria bacterium]
MLKTRFALLALLAILAAPLASLAQSYPAKPVRLVVPYPPGGSTDLLGRTVAQKMSESMGQNVIVENRGGAGGMLGSELVARSAPDGYTFLLGTGASHGITLFLSKTVPYDPVKDFTPICAAVEVPIALAIHPSIPANNAKELLEYAKKNPGKLAFGSSGTGSPHHLAGELLKQVGGIDMVHVPYKGAGPSMQDLIGGQIPIVFTTLSTAIPQMRSGKIRVIGVVERKRQESTPEVPTIGESVPGYVMPSSWLGFFGPAGLPEAIVARLNGEILKSVHAPEVRSKLESAGMPVSGTSAEEFARMVRDDIETFRGIVQASGIKPE